MGSHDRSELALAVLTNVANALRAETARGAIRGPLWIRETETLADRVDLVIAEIDQALFPVAQQRSMALRTLFLARGVLGRANECGDLYDTLWLADRTPCTLFDYLELTIAQFEEMQQQRPEAAT